ncbi:hypothetical protein [Thermococcus sp. 9N3]|uniref:hypothetical protein n=1 Tax=Thermococcus sp. 9N3 TaxID=163002 RepID=UPI0014312EF4|nr:hypothetical protein [Thermococcus sp. 9N3]NJE49045.1 hypothetical protein [Thermococcus sp. 9N3]
MKRDKTIFICIVALLFMVLATTIPPERYSGPGDRFIPTNGKFNKILHSFNATSLWNCTPKASMVVECRVYTEGELNGTLSFFESLPHDSIVLYAGEGGSFNVILTEEKGFKEKLPKTCKPINQKATAITVSQTERKKLMEKLRALGELETVIKNPAEKAIVQERIIELEYALGIRGRENVCNITSVDVNILYPPKKSNVPLMVALWMDAGLAGLIGIVLVRRGRLRRVDYIPFVVFLTLSLFFLGVYTHYTFKERSEERGIKELTALNKTNATISPSPYFLAVYGALEWESDAEKFETLVKRFNLSVRVEIVGESILAEGTLPLNDLEAFKETTRTVGFYVGTWLNDTENYDEQIRKLERVNRIIMVHLADISPESREVLSEIIEENRKAVQILRAGKNLVFIQILVDSSHSPSPSDYHHISKVLSSLGALVGVSYLVASEDKRNR